MISWYGPCCGHKSLRGPPGAVQPKSVGLSGLQTLFEMPAAAAAEVVVGLPNRPQVICCIRCSACV